MLQFLNYSAICDFLDEIIDNGEVYGYEREGAGESGYYQEYKDHFDELTAGAYNLWESLREYELRENWDDMTVALLGETHRVLGFDVLEVDYFGLLGHEENWATEEAMTRIERLTKRDLIRCFRNIMTILVLFFDIKSAHDCLTSIVEELDERGAILKKKSDTINRLYEDLTGSGENEFNGIIESVPQRMWVE